MSDRPSNQESALLAVLALAAASALGGFVACNDEPAGGGGAGGGASSSSATSSSSSTTSSSSSSAGGGFQTDCDFTPEPRPSTVPESWQAYTCWPGCTYWLAPNAEAMPEPITWEPCPDLGQWPRGECMRNTWDDGAGSSLGYAPNVDTSVPGSPRIQLTRGAESGLALNDRYNEWLIARADGEVEFAARATRVAPYCMLTERSVRGRHAAWSHTGPYESVVDGLLLLDLEARSLRSGYPDDSEFVASWAAGDGWVVRNDGRLTAIRPDGSEERVVHDGTTDPNGLGPDGRPIVVGEEIVYSAGNYSFAGIYGFHPAHGTRPLITYPSDLTQGAGNIGTDGTDLVWSHGHSRLADQTVYPEVDIYTAPFTTDPRAVERRRLRKDMALGMGTYAKQFAVGCGHAGRYIAESGLDAQLVRLSDGVAWRLTGAQLQFRWSRVLGISCDHAYVQVAYDAVGKGSPGQTTIVRVRLDELGEGLPPD